MAHMTLFQVGVDSSSHK